jgi:MFS family permease
VTIRGVASKTSRLFLGRLTALIGRRKLLITGTLVAAVAVAGASLPVSVAVITILTSLAGLGLGVGQPITMSWLAASAPSGARGRAMSLRLWATGSAVFGDGLVGCNHAHRYFADPAAQAMVNWPYVAHAGLDRLRHQTHPAPL